MTSTIEIGSEVGYAETFRGIKWTKIGVVVEVSGERVRVKWSHWIYASGYRKEDNKRTWVKATKLTLVK